MYHTFGSHTGCAVGDISHFALYFTMILSHSLQNYQFYFDNWHRAIGNTVRYDNFEMLISQLANVSHIRLPYWVHSRIFHSLCIVFCNDFVTFVLKLTTVTHFGSTAILTHCRVCQFWDAHLRMCECMKHLAPILGAQQGNSFTLYCVLQWFCHIRFKTVNFTSIIGTHRFGTTVRYANIETLIS